MNVTPEEVNRWLVAGRKLLLLNAAGFPIRSPFKQVYGDQQCRNNDHRPETPQRHVDAFGPLLLFYSCRQLVYRRIELSIGFDDLVRRQPQQLRVTSKVSLDEYGGP